jgi:integrase
VVTTDWPGIYKAKNGRWYHRNGGGALPGHPSDSKEASDAYWERRAGKHKKVEKRTLSKLIELYLDSPNFHDKKERTQEEYARYCRYLSEKAGTAPVKSFKRQHIIAMRDALADKPATSKYTLSVTKILFEYAIDIGWRKDNPAKGVKNVKQGEGHKRWPQAAIVAFRAVAEPDARLCFELCLGTGQRMGDVLKMRWADVDGQGVNVKQEKTGAELWVPFTDELIAYLAGVQKSGLTILSRSHGRAHTRQSIRGPLERARKAAGVMDYTMHGLRATRAALLAEEGKSDAQIQAITGHSTTAMAAHYRRGADQRKLAGKE